MSHVAPFGTPNTPGTLGALARDLVALPPGADGLPIAGIALDSRAVRPGFLFAALPGAAQDGRRHIADAVAHGAVAVLAPRGTEWPEGVAPVPLIVADEPRRTLARLAAVQAGPQPERMVAVTGTNGKTSTADFLRQIWTLGGIPAASLGTLGLVADVTLPEQPPSLTTPDSVALAAILSALAERGVRATAIEASSHGMVQFRLDGVRLSAAGFSNLTRDHLDYHGTLDAYRDAKLRLFSELLPAGAIACANADMEPSTLARLRGIAAARGLTLRLAGKSGDTIRLQRAVPLADGQMLELEAQGRRYSVRLSLPGRFQADNVLLAALLAEPDEDLLPSVLARLDRLVGVRGRMELAARLSNGSAAYVDYAHTPDALERLLSSLRPHAAEAGGRLVIVFGAGGDRDRGKRPLMGEAAARLADLVVVTDDNPRSEDPAAIRAAILAACPGALEIGDRRAAIAAGLDALRPGDVLVVAGKGHEQGQTVAGTVLPFDDAATIRALAGVA
jgi:UDP-N-acetylmuramoyl-L-alanyl-D-glutamate--2,6-diaminopimelate ligase